MTRDVRKFLEAAGWQDAEVVPLAGDASNRRYDRLTAPDGKTAVLMDAPPTKGEDVRPFVEIATFLRGIGLSAPEIQFSDQENGFLLIEDLGDHLFARELEASPEKEAELYHAAADVLVHLHAEQPPTLKRYDASTTVPLAALAYDWYLKGAVGEAASAARRDFCARLQPVLAPLDDHTTVLIQRDYHAENLLWLPERTGVARVGLLDFQDAMRGHPAYDLVSVLQDARRDVTPKIAEQVKSYFAEKAGHTPDAFDAAYAILGLQRNLRILGVFARLCLRDGKAHYVDLIPRVWAHIKTNLGHEAVSVLSPRLLGDLPEPTPQILETLKSKAGLWAGR